MNVNLRKLLVAAASCWLVLVCGSPERVEGAGQAATVDGILRSVVAVRYGIPLTRRTHWRWLCMFF